MSNQVLMRNQTIPLDFNNLGGANENNNFSQTYSLLSSKMNILFLKIILIITTIIIK